LVEAKVVVVKKLARECHICTTEKAPKIAAEDVGDDEDDVMLTLMWLAEKSFWFSVC
jgi:hypothetical protein